MVRLFSDRICLGDSGMQLLFKQRLFSWFDSYDIYDENENVVFVVKGELSWGHCLRIYDANGREVGGIQEKILTFLPKFELYENDECIGSISKEFSFFTPRYNIDYNGWYVEGNIWEWDYSITGPFGEQIAVISKQLFHWTDTYVIDIFDEKDALHALMVVLAIDAEKCSRNKG